MNTAKNALDWAHQAGRRWRANLDPLERTIAPIGDATLALAAVQTGERVLDVGCGGGLTSLALAERVGDGGEVLGIDIAPPLIETARARAAEHEFRNLRFLLADAATVTLQPGGYDCLFSRFGLMFFQDPAGALCNLRAQLRSGGRIVFCCWGSPQQNPWASLLGGIIRRHLDLPAPDPLAPGPFAFADTVRLQSLLQGAGFGNLQLQPWEGSTLVGGGGFDVAQAADFALQSFSGAEVLKAQPQAVQQTVRDDYMATLEPHLTADGVALGAMAWLVRGEAI
ncbi:MAG TPA: methyltransferase domain-containing protein [Hyphomicrobiales bacterium]|nr:methyltransferase domain-containing protein [Hyphomicrobiales bacterium]